MKLDGELTRLKFALESSLIDLDIKNHRLYYTYDILYVDFIFKII